MSRKPYFLPYQAAWLKDDSRLKIAEKSRRIGWTYVQAYEDVRDAAKAQGGMDVWFSSADLSAAREYIRYVEQWARLFDKAARSLGEILINEEDDIKALVVEFSNGKRIHALSSNPKAFRSKGGKVVLDEFAFHDHPDELWKAASPSVLWGYPIRVFSSHNGKNTRFYRMVQQAKQGNGWSLHTVTIEDAIQDGLVEKIKGLDRPATQDEIAEFVQECKNIAGDEETYQQEFMCNPQDDKEAYFPWSLIYANESPLAPGPVVILGQEVNDAHEADYRLPWEYRPEPGHRHFLGVDVGRNKDLTVMWLYELVGDVLWTRLWLEFHGVRFALQRKNLYALLEFVSRACIDSTGLGMQLAEEAQERYGAKVEPVNFSNALKVDLSVTYKRKLEDRLLRNPEHEAFRNDVNKIKREVTAGGYVRFVGERDENGHADRYWGAALAVHAAGNLSGPVEHEQLGAGPRFKRRGTY